MVYLWYIYGMCGIWFVVNVCYMYGGYIYIYGIWYMYMVIHLKHEKTQRQHDYSYSFKWNLNLYLGIVFLRLKPLSDGVWRARIYRGYFNIKYNGRYMENHG